MMHGLMWLPLLAVFIGLAWAGWNEYQKVEAYRVWAEGAERAKYDIRAALVQRGNALTWGVPSRSGIIDPTTIALDGIEAVQVRVDHELISLDTPPSKGTTVMLELKGREADSSGYELIAIPFTDVNLAVQWAIALRQDRVSSDV